MWHKMQSAWIHNMKGQLEGLEQFWLCSMHRNLDTRDDDEFLQIAIGAIKSTRLKCLKIRCAHIISTSLLSCLEREKKSWGILWEVDHENPSSIQLYSVVSALCRNAYKSPPRNTKAAAVLQDIPLGGRNSSMMNSHTSWTFLFPWMLIQTLVQWHKGCCRHAKSRAPCVFNNEGSWGMLTWLQLEALWLTTAYKVFMPQSNAVLVKSFPHFLLAFQYYLILSKASTVLCRV